MEERAGCLTLFVMQMSCDCYCSVALPHSAVGWSVVCYCGISCSYSLAFSDAIPDLCNLTYFHRNMFTTI